MSAPPRTWRPFAFSSICLSVALVATAIIYSHLQPKDTWLLTAALPAFLIEGLCYLAAALESPRQAFAKIESPFTKAALLWGSTLVPYLLFSLLAGTFQPRDFLLLLALTAIFCFWHVLLPRRWIYGAGFLVIAAAPIVSRVFHRIYISPDPHVAIDILGHVMWLRAGIVALLVLREWNPGAFGLWPQWREWKLGALFYALSILPLCLFAVALHDVQFAPLHKPPLQIAGVAIGTFFGILWVVALGEELLFRGVIARAIFKVSHSQAAAVIVSAILFGTAHLWYHAFPNWHRALVATLLGLFCGTLYLRSNSIRASMVTHALVVVTWRVLFTA